MMRFGVVNKFGEVVSSHKNLDLANAKLIKIDNVKSSIFSTDVDWLKGKQQAYQGYKYRVHPVNVVDRMAEESGQEIEGVKALAKFLSNKKLASKDDLEALEIFADNRARGLGFEGWQDLHNVVGGS